ncbi:MAG: enoyl-CoA hydratase-related protein [Salinirussus sp.]
MSGTVHVDGEGHVWTITIENAGKRNALDYALIDDIVAAFEDLAARDDRAIIVLRGAGEKAFSAGFDLDIDRSDQTPEQKAAWPGLLETVDTHPYPVIGMINGDCFGGAVGLAAACDLRIGVTSARFGVTPARVGLVYGGDAIGRLIDLIGPAKTKELLYTAEPMAADHAAEVGLLNHAVPRENLEDRTYEMAATIASNAPFSLRKMKEVVDAITSKNDLTKAEQKWVQRLRDEAFESEDHAEGRAAFAEGREPEFTGK